MNKAADDFSIVCLMDPIASSEGTQANEAAKLYPKDCLGTYLDAFGWGLITIWARVKIEYNKN